MFGLDIGILWGLILIVSAIMAVFVPFWIYRIRSEAIKTNQMLGALIELNGGKNPNDYMIGNSTKATKKCIKCGRDNRSQDYICAYCGTSLP